MIGKSLAHYEILDPLGAGGMGEVWRARDTKLGREVAIKLLPDEVSQDPERVARFRREAKLLASLNHPNIAAIYDLEEADGRVFLVMEVAEGQDLSDRLKLGALPVDKALDVAQQITEGLEEAHAKGIVHRDLKPANVMLAESGRIKLLDFGLARAYHGDQDEGDPAKSPTITAAMTQQGVILGTAAYMSPEQARGKAVDKQSDIWAFGALLYEMLTAQRLFDGETISDSIGAILHKQPDWTLLPANTPPQVHQLLHRCLERDRDNRLRDIGDARVALGEARRDPTGSSMGLSGIQTSAPQGGGKNWALVGITALLALALGIFAGPRLFGSQEELPYRKLDLGVELISAASQENGTQVVISRDGKAVAFTHDGKIWSQFLDELEARELDGSTDAYAPFWSPDGTEIGWFQDSKLWKAPVRGGRPVAICEITDRTAGGVGACWTEEGRILFALGSTGIFDVSAMGGQPQILIPLAEDQGDLHEPSALPGDGGVLHVIHPVDAPPATLALWRDGTSTVLFVGAEDARVHSPVYDGQRYILFRQTRGEATEGLWAMEFDAASGEVRGEPFLVQSDASAGSVAEDGTLVYVSNPQRAGENLIARVGFDGMVRETVVSPRTGDLDFAVSPDGQRICFTAEARDGAAQEIWVKDLVRGTEMRLASHTDPTFVPHWSHDGSEIFFSRAEIEHGMVGTWHVPADGSRPATRVANGLGSFTTMDGTTMASIRSRGKDTLSFNRNDTTDIWLVPLDDPDSARKVLEGQSSQFPTALSPDGRYLLYESNISGQWTLYLTRFPELTGRWQVSPDGEAGRPSFAGDGSRIYYETGMAIYAVDFESGDSPVLGAPSKVALLPEDSTDNMIVERDGNSFLVVQAAKAKGEDEARPNRQGIKVVQNWTAGIR